jgi:molecular chaperone GrpE
VTTKRPHADERPSADEAAAPAVTSAEAAAAADPAEADPPAVDPAAEAPAGGQTLADVTRDRDDLHDRLLRTAAEFDNFRKRTERERRELHEAAAADLIRDLLPVVDDLERALAAAPADRGADTLEGFREGVELIHRQVLDVLRRRGVQPIETEGQPFDPNWHEAVVYESADGRPDGEIIGEVRRGYRLGQRLLRPSMVRVAKA